MQVSWSLYQIWIMYLKESHIVFFFFLSHIFHGTSRNTNCHKQQTTGKTPASVLFRLTGCAGSIRYFQKPSQFQLSLRLLTRRLSVVLPQSRCGVSTSAPLLVMVLRWHVNHLPRDSVGNPPFPQFTFKSSVEWGVVEDHLKM